MKEVTVLVALAALTVITLVIPVYLTVRERNAFDDHCRAIGGIPVHVGHGWMCVSPDQRILEGR